MARIKYGLGITPICKKHAGFTFQKNHYGESMQPSARNTTNRTTKQRDRMQNLQKCVRFWRTMSPATKTAWINFAAAYPQPTKRDPSVFLTGYQCFIKRNHYCFLNYGIEIDFMEIPEMDSLPAGSPIFSLTAGNNQIDITEEYIKNFGFIPEIGQTLQIMAIPYSELSGQFFPPIFSVVQVLAIYIDGFFLNIEMPVVYPNINYSIYLSKPLNKGFIYSTSKIRYMGCFTTKSFLGLSDTPSSYLGQAGKIPTVNLAENALEFKESSGGGITCADLPTCPEIININDTLNDIMAIIIPAYNVSIPEVHYGALINGYAVETGLLFPSEGWRIPTWDDITVLINLFGGTTLANQPLKETGNVYWSSIGGINTSKFNSRGAGRRYQNGTFSNLQQENYILTKPPIGQTGYWRSYYTYNQGNAVSYSNETTYLRRAYSIRPCRTVSGIANGTIGVYKGNNGRYYRTVVQNNIEWVADAIAETHFTDGSIIPYISDTATWDANRQPAWCAPNNLLSNV